MKTSFLLFLCLLAVTDFNLLSQTAHPNEAFVSINTGGFFSAHEDFAKIYNSNFGLTLGTGLGFPVYNRIYLLGKATYFSKTGTPIVDTYNIDSNGKLTKNSEIRDGTASFKQWIIDGGLQYSFILTQDYAIGINGGIMFSIIREHQSSLNGTLSSAIEGSGIFGYFAGISLERHFTESPFSIFGEAQYNFSRSDILNLIGSYGGTNITIGLRYYFTFK